MTPMAQTVGMLVWMGGLAWLGLWAARQLRRRRPGRVRQFQGEPG